MFANMKTTPDAYAQINGNENGSKVHGNVYFFGVHGGTIVTAEIYGLPIDKNSASGNFHGFHIHSGSACTGTAQDPYADVDGHFNPTDTNHPNHVGDLPPLMANQAVTWSAVYTERFYPEDVVGRTIIIHELADDFHTQPSGNAGAMIACGEIVDL